MTQQEKLYKRIAEQLKVSKYIVEDVFKSQFDLIAKEMELRSDVSVRLPRIGIFFVHKNRRKYLETYKKRNDERKQQQRDD
jgi:nucleoid DNA-binding protein